jgi:hypothetical protein
VDYRCVGTAVGVGNEALAEKLFLLLSPEDIDHETFYISAIRTDPDECVDVLKWGIAKRIPLTLETAKTIAESLDIYHSQSYLIEVQSWCRENWPNESERKLMRSIAIFQDLIDFPYKA